MRWMMVVAGFLVTGAAHAGFADGVPVSAAEKECHLQAVLIDQTYRFYRGGAAEQQAVEQQTDPKASPATRSWIKKMVRDIYADSRSLVVNVDATTYSYEQQCLRDPGKYIRDKRLLQ